MVSAIGIDDVAIGMDSDLVSDRDSHGTRRLRRICSPRAFLDEMTSQDLNDKVLNGNYARVFTQAWRDGATLPGCFALPFYSS